MTESISAAWDATAETIWLKRIEAAARDLVSVIHVHGTDLTGANANAFDCWTRLLAALSETIRDSGNDFINRLPAITDPSTVAALETLDAPPTAPEATDELTRLREECNLLRKVIDDAETQLVRALYDGDAPSIITVAPEVVEMLRVALVHTSSNGAALSTDTKAGG